jgi:hypothetical protein
VRQRFGRPSGGIPCKDQTMSALGVTSDLTAGARMRSVARVGLVGAFALTASLAQADEPRGCDRFKWPIAQEQAALNGPQKVEIAVGGSLKLDQAASVLLTPLAQADFRKPPERSPTEPSTYAGTIKLEPLAVAGVYKISLSGAGWIDVIQGDRFIKPTGVSGALDCPGVRKSVKFPLRIEPTTIQLSNVKTPRISVVVSKD